MILVIDIGNTNIVLGCMEGTERVFTARLGSDRNKTSDEFALMISGLLRLRKIDPHHLEGGIISSVVPELTMVLHSAVKLLAGIDLLVVGSGLKTGVDIRIDSPSKLGSDRVADAVAALHKYPQPTVIIDLGTATTLSVLDKQGRYLGGMICPGVRVSVDALSSRTAQLPHINLETPGDVIGKNTETCMQAGVVYGHAAMLDGLLDRIEASLGQTVTPVITGGLGRVILPHCKRKIIYDEYLLLDGLRILYEKNKKI